MILLILFFMFTFTYAVEVCVKEVDNPYPEPYLNIAVRKNVERAVLTSGNTLGCSQGSKDLKVYIRELKDEPVAYTPKQRVSDYNLKLSLTLKIGDRERSYTQSSVYLQSSGRLGNLPRRQAIDTIMSMIYLELVRDIRYGVD